MLSRMKLSNGWIGGGLRQVDGHERKIAVVRRIIKPAFPGRRRQFCGRRHVAALALGEIAITHQRGWRAVLARSSLRADTSPSDAFLGDKPDARPG
jgi:hypothetical protein